MIPGLTFLLCPHAAPTARSPRPVGPHLLCFLLPLVTRLQTSRAPKRRSDYTISSAYTSSTPIPCWPLSYRTLILPALVSKRLYKCLKPALTPDPQYKLHSGLHKPLDLNLSIPDLGLLTPEVKYTGLAFYYTDPFGLGASRPFTGAPLRLSCVGLAALS